MNYIILIFLTAIILELMLILIYIHRIKDYIIFSNNGKNIKTNEDLNEDEDTPKVKGIDKINTFKPEDFDKNI